MKASPSLISPASGRRTRLGKRTLPLLLLLALGAWLGLRENPAPPTAPGAASAPANTLLRPAASAETATALKSLRPSADTADEPPPPLETPATRPQKMADLPPTEQASLQRAIFTAMHTVEPLTEAQAALPANEGASHFATHPGQKINARFLKNGGVTLASSRPGKTWRGTLRLDSSKASGWQTDATRAERPAGPALTEWYENRADGLEHGFTLAARPAAAGETGFSLDMALDGLIAEADPDRAGDLVFTDPATDQAVLAYRNLKVWDATGRELAAAMRPTARGLRFTVRDEDAAYPVTIDPLIASLEAVIPPAAGDYDFVYDTAGSGIAVAVSGDTALVGVGTPSAETSAVHVLKRSLSGWGHTQTLKAADAAANDYFGNSVTLDGDTAIIGAPLKNGTVATAGAAYVFVSNASGAWVPQAKLTAPDAVNGDRFGSAVALSGGTALISSRGANGAGAVHVFTRTGAAWSRQQKLTLPGAVADDGFGTRVDIDEDTALIGAPGRVNWEVVNNTGAAYLYTRSGGVWTQQERFYSTESDVYTFGLSVSLDADTAVIGDPTSNSAHIYRRNGNSWSHVVLTPDDIEEEDLFGYAVCLDGNILLVSAPNWPDVGNGHVPPDGKVYVYRREGDAWNERGKLSRPSNGAFKYGQDVAMHGATAVIGMQQFQSGQWTSANVVDLWPRLGLSPSQHKQFGLAVDIDGDVAVAGAPDYLRLNGGYGVAWVLSRRGTTWVPQQMLTNDDSSTGDHFGASVAVSGNRVVVGAADLDNAEGVIDRGSATIFERGADGRWMLRNKLGAEAAAGDNFGRSVAIEGDTVAVGAPMKNGARGRVWTYALGAGTSVQAQEITPPASAGQVRFGFSVALSGNRMIVGAPRWDTGGGLRTGRVFFYKRESGNWAADGATGPSGAGATDYRAGISVALDGNVAVAGCGGPSIWTGGGSPKPGRAFVLAHDGTAWGTSPTWLDHTGLDGDGAWFGMSVAVENDVIAVGAFGYDTQAGRVRLFGKQGASWVRQQDISAPGSADTVANGFGVSTALSGDTLLVGAYGANSGAGAAYVYRLEEKGLTITRSGGNVVLNWPANTGLALWYSTTMADPWTKVAGSENAATHTVPVSAAPRMFFRLAPP